MDRELTVIPKEFPTFHSGVELPDTIISQLPNQDSSNVFIFKISTGVEDDDTDSEKSLFVSVCDFYDSEDLGGEMVFMSQWMMNHLGVDFGNKVNLEYVENLPEASYIKIKPNHESLLNSVIDVEDFFTNYLQNFKVIQTGIKYPIFHQGREYFFYFEEIKKGDVDIKAGLSCNVDLVTEFAEPIERIPSPPAVPAMATATFKPQSTATFSAPIDETKKGFQAFTGKGYRLDE